MSSIHEGVSCNMCMKSNFSGKRYKCLICFDYDLCTPCHEKSQENLLSRTATTKPGLPPPSSSLGVITQQLTHQNTHAMQCILTKSDLELFYGPITNPNDYVEQLSFTCPYCGKLGLSESTLCDHLSTQHLNNQQTEQLIQEVVCPICAALPSGTGSDPNLLTEDLLHHIQLEHLNSRNTIGNTTSNSSVAAAAALRFSRRLNYAQNSASSSRAAAGSTTATSSLSNRNNTFRFQFGNSSSGTNTGSALSSFMRSASTAIDSFGSGSGGSSDPIVELLSQLTGVRRAAANAYTANLTLAQLTRERESLQQQSSAVARHHHNLFTAGSGASKLGISAKSNLASNNGSSASTNSSLQIQNQVINQILELPTNLFMQQLPPNSRDSRYLLAK